MRMQDPGSMHKGIAVDAAQAQELRLLQTRDKLENPFLFSMGQFGLKADQIEHGFFLVFRPQLDHGKGSLPSAGIGESHRLEGTKGQGHFPPFSHGFYRKTALKMNLSLEILAQYPLAGQQSVAQGMVLLFS